jgi:hypothetical protein
MMSPKVIQRREAKAITIEIGKGKKNVSIYTCIPSCMPRPPGARNA